MWITTTINPKYEVNENGEIRHKERKQILHTRLDRYGYKRVILSGKNGKAQHPTVHRLVAIAFIPNPKNYPQINHKDENKQNNTIANLEWCDCKYNSNYGTAIERSAAKRKKAVCMTKDGCIIAHFESITEAAKAIGIEDGYITAVLHGRQKTAGGYGWLFEKR